MMLCVFGCCFYVFTFYFSIFGYRFRILPPRPPSLSQFVFGSSVRVNECVCLCMFWTHRHECVTNRIWHICRNGKWRDIYKWRWESGRGREWVSPAQKYRNTSNNVRHNGLSMSYSIALTSSTTLFAHQLCMNMRLFARLFLCVLNKCYWIGLFYVRLHASEYSAFFFLTIKKAEAKKKSNV